MHSSVSVVHTYEVCTFYANGDPFKGFKGVEPFMFVFRSVYTVTIQLLDADAHFSHPKLRHF
jgi:hypothetical protein